MIIYRILSISNEMKTDPDLFLEFSKDVENLGVENFELLEMNETVAIFGKKVSEEEIISDSKEDYTCNDCVHYKDLYCEKFKQSTYFSESATNCTEFKSKY